MLARCAAARAAGARELPPAERLWLDVQRAAFADGALSVGRLRAMHRAGVIPLAAVGRATAAPAPALEGEMQPEPLAGTCGMLLDFSS
jgi:hypothetical protein